LEGFSNVFCLDPYDLAAVKIVAGREKDLALVRNLLDLEKIEIGKLRERFHSMPLGERQLFRADKNLGEVSETKI